MIRTLIFLGLWAVLPTPAQVGSAALYTEFRSKPAPVVLEALRQEVDALMAPNGLHFVWTSISESPFTSWPEVAVVTFSGRCEVRSSALAARTATRRLGWTHLSNGVILPFAEIDCDAIFAYICRDLWSKPAHDRETMLGRAIARVTAHELLHIFSGTAAHSDHGVDHATLSVWQLLADDLNFDELDPTAHIVHSASTAASPDNNSPLAGKASYSFGGCASCHGASAEGTHRGPRLRVKGHPLDPIDFVARLAKHQDIMFKRARAARLAPPSLDENDISSLVRFLNTTAAE